MLDNMQNKNLEELYKKLWFKFHAPDERLTEQEVELFGNVATELKRRGYICIVEEKQFCESLRKGRN